MEFNCLVIQIIVSLFQFLNYMRYGLVISEFDLSNFEGNLQSSSSKKPGHMLIMSIKGDHNFFL